MTMAAIVMTTATIFFVVFLAEVVGGAYSYEVWPQTALGEAEPVLKFKISAHVEVR